MAPLALTHSLTAYLIGRILHTCMWKIGSLHLGEWRSTVKIEQQFLHTGAHTHNRNCGEWMYIETKNNGFAWHRQQTTEWNILRIEETRIYMRHAMRILKDQFYGTEKCSPI